MTVDDDSYLAALWSAPPPREEQREAEHLARRTPGFARAAQWGELAVVGGIALAIIGAVALRFAAESMLTGGLLLLLLGWSAWKRHQLANQALLIDDHNRLAFVSSGISAKEAEVRRSAIGFALVLPGALLMMLLYFSMNSAGDKDFLAFVGEAISRPRGMIGLAALLGVMLLVARSHRRLLAELTGLRSLREEYAREARQDLLDGR
jgi:hypothetical protein